MAKSLTAVRSAERILCQPLLAHGRAKSLDVCVLLRLTRLDECTLRLMYPGPLLHRIAADMPRHWTTRSRLRVTRNVGRENDVDGQGPLVEVVDQAEQLGAPAVAEHVMQTSVDNTCFSASAFSRTMRFFGLIRRFSSRFR